MQWLVITPTYQYKDVILDDGTGPVYPILDTVEVEADTKKEAISKGVNLMLQAPASFDFRYVHNQRMDGACPYTRVIAECLGN